MKLAAYAKLCSGYEYGYTKGESGLATEAVRGGGRRGNPGGAAGRGSGERETGRQLAPWLPLLLLPRGRRRQAAVAGRK